MRRFVCSFLLLLLVISSTHAFAYEIDLSILSDAELISLKDRIIAEINTREIETSNLIYPGTYFVGQDIKSGQYLLSLTYSERNYIRVYIFENEEQYRKYLKADRGTGAAETEALKDTARVIDGIFTDNGIINITLNDGMVLIIEDGTGSLETVVSSWAP